MDYNELYKKPEEKIIKRSKASCFGNDNQLIYGFLVLTNFRIYLQLDDEYKINEILLTDIRKVSIGGINVLRFEKKDGIRTNFLVSNVIGWNSVVKKAIKNSRK